MSIVRKMWTYCKVRLSMYHPHNSEPSNFLQSIDPHSRRSLRLIQQHTYGLAEGWTLFV